MKVHDLTEDERNISLDLTTEVIDIFYCRWERVDYVYI
jgi:hypothetical protein